MRTRGTRHIPAQRLSTRILQGSSEANNCPWIQPICCLVLWKWKRHHLDTLHLYQQNIIWSVIKLKKMTRYSCALDRTCGHIWWQNVSPLCASKPKQTISNNAVSAGKEFLQTRAIAQYSKINHSMSSYRLDNLDKYLYWDQLCIVL